MLMRDTSRFLSQPENDIDWNIVGKMVPPKWNAMYLLVRAYYIYWYLCFAELFVRFFFLFPCNVFFHRSDANRQSSVFSFFNTLHVLQNESRQILTNRKVIIHNGSLQLRHMTW